MSVGDQLDKYRAGVLVTQTNEEHELTKGQNPRTDEVNETDEMTEVRWHPVLLDRTTFLRHAGLCSAADDRSRKQRNPPDMRS